MKFKELHSQDSPLLLFNVWDVNSTKIAEKLRFDAIGTSSSAIATMLGYQDGEEMTFSELEYIVKRITDNTRLPVSIDLEAGYSRNTKQVVNYIKRLANLGVVGINLEDSIVRKKRELVNQRDFSQLLSEIKNQLEKEGVEMFINIRTDAFLVGHANAVEESVKRIKSYESVGADGIFTPCIIQESDIEMIVQSTILPVNVMYMPNLPDFDTLTKLGVKRISMGNFLFEYANSTLEKLTMSIVTNRSFSSIF